MTSDLAISKLFRAFLIVVVLHLLALCSPPASAVPAPKLDETEVEVLREIAKKIGKTDWDFGIDPCSDEGNWNVPDQPRGIESSVMCNCSFPNNTCHIVSIVLKGQNLSGELPPEFQQLRFLKRLDLSRNVLTGSVPREWIYSTITDLSLMGNRLSGPFSVNLARMDNLVNLSIEGNRFSGRIPYAVHLLFRMERLAILANELSGKLPQGFFEMTNLIDLRLSSNNFSGEIPEFISNFSKLEKLHIQGSSFEGPIPSSFSALTRMADLRISDLKGEGSPFPDLGKMKSLRTLILRNCSIYGEIPAYIGFMKNLKHLDLSFNELTGQIPLSFDELGRVDFVYLNGNMLTGLIPHWILKRNKNVDISYNNFTFGGSSPTQCPQGSINSVESYSSNADNIHAVHPCLKRNFPCDGQNRQYQSSLYINCGGRETTIDGITYEADIEQRGASTVYLGPNWALSSTGNFMDDDSDADNYIVTSTSAVSVFDPEFYTSARLSPLSLTYYGLCMLNGYYTVKLHFAEIVFKDDNTFISLGKRLFNVFIQRKMVLENFDISEAAGGSGRPIVKIFTTFITNHTLEIQFYWAGRGTTGIPNRGVYGPLISAISVEPNFKLPSDKIHSPLQSLALIAACVLSVLALFFGILAGGICWVRKYYEKESISAELQGLDLQIGIFTLRQIKAATGNFDPANKIGEGGFGPVYKGLLSDGTMIAVKQLSARSKQGNHEFVNEIGMISALQHPNLVKLYGCCTEGNQLLLIYEFMENNCLSRALFGMDAPKKLKLDWPTRWKICLGIAKGLVYLHEESRLKIVHRDIKASNVLLDRDLNAKISDFGLAKLNDEGHSHISTKVAGTIGYMAPEYAMRGYLTDKADVYSFGVVGLEIVSGRSNTNYKPKEDFDYLLDWACVLQEQAALLELVDPNLEDEFSAEEATLMLKVALLCTNASPSLRPSMSQVVSLLEGRMPVQPLLSRLSPSNTGTSASGYRRNFWENPEESEIVAINETCSESALFALQTMSNNLTSADDSFLAANFDGSSSASIEMMRNLDNSDDSIN